MEKETRNCRRGENDGRCHGVECYDPRSSSRSSPRFYPRVVVVVVGRTFLRRGTRRRITSRDRARIPASTEQFHCSLNSHLRDLRRRKLYVLLYAQVTLHCLRWIRTRICVTYAITSVFAKIAVLPTLAKRRRETRSDGLSQLSLLSDDDRQVNCHCNYRFAQFTPLAVPLTRPNETLDTGIPHTYGVF